MIRPHVLFVPWDICKTFNDINYEVIYGSGKMFQYGMCSIFLYLTTQLTGLNTHVDDAHNNRDRLKLVLFFVFIPLFKCVENYLMFNAALT